MRVTCSFTFYCRESKKTKQGLSPLEMSIVINGDRLFLNLPVKFSPRDFNKKRKPVEIDNIITQYRVKTNEIIGELMQQGRPITAETLREYLRTGGVKTYTINTLVDDYMDNLRKTRLGVSMKQGVFEKYILVAQFLKGEIGNRELCTITNGDIIKIYNVLKSKYLPSTSAGYMIKIKSMFYYAMDNGYMKINPCNSIKINKGAVRVEYLTSEDINKIKGLNLADFDRLDRVRDLMLFQMSVGVAYCDLITFDSSKIEVINNVPTYTSNRQKTGVEFTSVILPEGMQILKKYDGHLPVISNQKYNAYLKDIQKLANVKTNITTHLLRKTYAHILLNNGVNISAVAKCLGHTTTQITQRCYCRPSTEFVVNEMSKLMGAV